MTREIVVQVENLDCHYGDFKAVSDVSFEAARGECYALLGTNGAGKTTTLETVQGFRRPTRGNLRVFGANPSRKPHTVRQRAGVVLQSGGHFGEITVRQTVELFASLSSRSDDVDAVIARVGLDHRTKAVVQTLSGGERRRLDLALAMWGRPELIVLDEPTTGLDPESRKTLWHIISDLKSGGTTVLLTTHYLEEAERLADHVGIMHEGRLAIDGTLDEVLASRPARMTAEIMQAPDDWFPSPPPGVSITFGEKSGTRTVTVEADDQQASLHWLLQDAHRVDAQLGMIRANPASLEDIFHQISQSSGATQ
ncbi:ABC transporter ATP-binding protein [Hoyosella rhizosphaerae]|uniref:Multidrug ABC transporter ATP-binding protein n=1 Tax=Hoyosella rhizosphaerae TaxID=1755582 RepID=A0A916TZY2_9ACTN|nr:ABC transporter ATP-binding protein [Hoyosella rhizosphaerae]MBN4927128.1 ABC transporter ATP-binding protein [Hoyosella rhizosphaerae]GGC53758.1 multidrug ABC transporter ATP-binding protein [Hoyosella rhizosphaerae]